MFLKESPSFSPWLKVGHPDRSCRVEKVLRWKGFERNIIQSLNDAFVHPVAVDRCVSSTDGAPSALPVPSVAARGPGHLHFGPTVVL